MQYDSIEPADLTAPQLRVSNELLVINGFIERVNELFTAGHYRQFCEKNGIPNVSLVPIKDEADLGLLKIDLGYALQVHWELPDRPYTSLSATVAFGPVGDVEQSYLLRLGCTIDNLDPGPVYEKVHAYPNDTCGAAEFLGGRLASLICAYFTQNEAFDLSGVTPTLTF